MAGVHGQESVLIRQRESFVVVVEETWLMIPMTDLESVFVSVAKNRFFSLSVCSRVLRFACST